MKILNKRSRYLIYPLASVTILFLIGAIIYFGLDDQPEADFAFKPPKAGYHYLGVVVPLSGPLTPMGQSFIRGAELAVQKANAALTKGGRPFKILFEDEAATIPNQKRLAKDYRVNVIIGHLMERSLLRSQPLYVSTGCPVILPVISSPEVCKLGQDSFFRLMPADDAQARALAEFTQEKLKPSSVLVIHEDSKYGRLLAETFSTSLDPKSNIEIEEVIYPENPEGLIELASKAATHKPEAIFLALHAYKAIYVTQALKQADFKATILGTHALAVSDVISFLSNYSTEFFLSLPFNPIEPGDEARSFTDEFKNQYYRFPDWIAIMAYQAVTLAIEAVKAADGDQSGIKEYLARLNGSPEKFDGLNGNYSFEVKGCGKGPVHVVRAGPSLLGQVP